jgi:translocation and assembly module TamA
VTPIPHPRIGHWAATLALGIALAQPAAFGASAQVELSGVEGELADAVRANLELSRFAGRDVSLVQARRLHRLAPEQIRAALEPYGYYQAQVEGELVPIEARPGQPAADTAGGVRSVLRVTLGPRVTIRASNVRVEGPAAQLPEIRGAVAGFRPAVGAALEHGVYEASKAQIVRLLQTRGFFDTQLRTHRVEVTRAAGAADIDLSWTSGERYAFGSVNFPDTPFPDAFLQRFAPWRAGEPYSLDQLLAFQQRLLDADYFASVLIEPNVAARADGRVPIDATLVPAKRTVYTAKAFFSTDVGPGGSLGVQRRWLNAAGHKAGITFDYSRRLQDVTASHRIPLPAVDNRAFTFAAGYRDEQTDSSQQRLTRL